MDDRRCFVQFPHPGDEHRPDKDGHIGWNPRKRNCKNNKHRRKFLEFGGEWIDNDGRCHSDTLWAWGEWEAESTCVRCLSSPTDSQCPHHLWSPYWVPKPSYDGLHNTDPFIFGGRILYSNCGQDAENKQALRHLAPGSVIAFGSGKKRGGECSWVLDTVLVIRDSFWYDPAEPAQTLAGKVSKTFLDVTGEPLRADAKLRNNPNERRLRLYRGATPNEPVCGMYSFFPAMRAGDDEGFARPSIERDAEYINPKSIQAPKGATHHINCDAVLKRLWKSLVDQVRCAGLVIGTRADLPPRREG